MSRAIEDLQPDLQVMARELLARCEAVGIPLVVTQTLRTFEEQQALYDQGRTKPGKIVTNAKAGESPHNFGLAFDVAFKTPGGGVTWDGPWQQVGGIGANIGLSWGGRWKGFKDFPHFEVKNWKTRKPEVATLPLLKQGDRGSGVERLQRLLNTALGLKVDGDWGRKTTDALTIFFNRSGFKGPGWGSHTTTPEVWAALERAARDSK